MAHLNVPFTLLTVFMLNTLSGTKTADLTAFSATSIRYVSSASYITGRSTVRMLLRIKIKMAANSMTGKRHCDL